MSFLSAVILIAALLIFIIGFFTLARTTNAIRMILALEILMKAVTLLVVFAGLVTNQMSLMQTFIVTIIVVEVVIAVIAVGLVVNAYDIKGSIFNLFNNTQNNDSREEM